MSDGTPETEVAALVVSKRNIPDRLGNDDGSHLPERNDSADQKQSGVTTRTKKDIMEYDEDNVRQNAITSVEGNTAHRNYLYNPDRGESHIPVSDRSDHLEKNTNHCKRDVTPPDCGRSCIHHEHENTYGGDNYYSTQEDQEKYLNYSEEHSYQRKNRVALPLNHFVKDYGHQMSIGSPNGIVESSFSNQSCLNTVHVPSNGQSYVQMRNLPVEFHQEDSYHQREYNEYRDDDASSNHKSGINTEDCERYVRAYVHSEDSYILREESDSHNYRNPCQDNYYNYDHDSGEVYEDGAAVSTMQHHSEGQISYHVDKFNEKGTVSPQENAVYQEESYNYHQHNMGDSENITFQMNTGPQEESRKEEDNSRKYYDSSPQENNVCTYEEGSTIQKDETSAVDLRILKPLTYQISSGKIQIYINSKNESVIVSRRDDNDLANNYGDNVSLSKTCEEQHNSLSTSSYLIPDQTCNEEEYSYSADQPIQSKRFHHEACETIELHNNNLWDAATNTDHLKVEDKESQTTLVEVRDISVQTDPDNTVFPLALLKSSQADIVKHTCPICQKIYISKSSFERHLRTHGKETNVIGNVRFTTEAKLQICKRPGKNKHVKTHKSIIMQVPRSIFQCSNCEKIFTSKIKQNNHDCIPSPFPLTKCPECPIKFYTIGALNQHIGIAHKKENSYYCIFCNKSFNAGYNFHLHLDEHLTSQ